METEIRSHSCTYCGKTFKLERHLTVHLRVHTGELPYLCSICGKSFSQSSHLGTHMRTYSDETPYTCSVCLKGFKRRDSLTAHQRTHSKETPHTCKTCGKSFKEKGNLTNHQGIHTGVHPYVCKNAFSQRISLENHTRTGSKETPCIFSSCWKEFKWKWGLNAHLTVHTGESPYTYSDCGKSFSQNRSLKHILIHSNDILHTYSYCGKSFRQEGHLTGRITLHSCESHYTSSVNDKSSSESCQISMQIERHQSQGESHSSSCTETFCSNPSSSIFEETRTNNENDVKDMERVNALWVTFIWWSHCYSCEDRGRYLDLYLYLCINDYMFKYREGCLNCWYVYISWLSPDIVFEQRRFVNWY